jgi:modulator of FtsH protease
MLNAWSSFFQGELGAAAALAGLLFVSVSVNQTKILELGRMADRGLEALGILFLIIMVTSLPLVPGQPLRLLGAEILVLGATALIATVLLQRSYMRQVEAPYRRSSMTMVAVNRLVVTVIVLAGLTLVWRGDDVGLYLLPAGILLSFFAASASAWVLLIEINPIGRWRAFSC